MTTYWCEQAWLRSGVQPGVLITSNALGQIEELTTGVEPPPDAHRLTGLVLAGFANAHSHAFHRALRGLTHFDGGTFWSWRTAMYDVAARLTPENYYELARAVYAEMAVAGVTCVGEFHYVHHPVGGGRYAVANEMGEVLTAAARAAGIRITLLDTCYLAGGINQPLAPEQVRFGDGSVAAWMDRVAELPEPRGVRVGAAIHSVRAVPRPDLSAVAAAFPDRPLHVHLSEQPAENDACLAAYGATPTELLAEAGVLGERTTAVHATHLSTQDIRLLGETGTGVCFCPTTEADLGDGIGPALELRDAGVPLSLGSDQHAVVDPLLEARALEHGERLRSGQRGRLNPHELLAALTSAGHRGLGWPTAGTITWGAPADLVAIRLDSPRTAGCLPEQVLLAATAADVHTVVADGQVIARDGHHESIGDVGAALTEAIHPLRA
jgi:formiminoglutamate deiminase